MTAWSDTRPPVPQFDVRSRYVERFWLPVLGPSALWLLRRLTDGLDTCPQGFVAPLQDLARAIGLGGLGSRHSPFQRAMLRCARYGTLSHQGEGVVAVRRQIGALPQHHLLRLPAPLQEEHRRWLARPASPDLLRSSAMRLALELAQVETDPITVERHLHRWGAHPAIAHHAATWATSRVRSLAEGSGGRPCHSGSGP